MGSNPFLVIVWGHKQNSLLKVVLNSVFPSLQSVLTSATPVPPALPSMRQTAERPRYSLVLKLIFFSREHGHYRPPSSSPVSSSRTTATTSADPPAASAAPPPGTPRPPTPSIPPEPALCISRLPALEAGENNNDERGVGMPVRFGSASPSPRAEGSAIVPSYADAQSSPPSGLEGGGDGHRGSGGDGGVGGVSRVGGDGVGVGEGGSGSAEEPPSSSSSLPLVEVRPAGVKGKGLFATR